MSALLISNIPSADRMSALPFGMTDEGQDPKTFDHYRNGVFIYLDKDLSEPVGFSILELSKLDLDSKVNEDLWEFDSFDVPTLGLEDASIGAIVTATRQAFGDEPTLNRTYFEVATKMSGDEAVDCWRMCLECGDVMAHFGLGCALLEIGEPREAFQHLRYYAHIAPVTAWNWRWYGKAAEAIGEIEEARKAYQEAIRLNKKYCQEETDAVECLKQLELSQPDPST